MELVRGKCGTEQITFVIVRDLQQGATRKMTYGEDRARLILDLERTLYISPWSSSSSNSNERTPASIDVELKSQDTPQLTRITY